MRAARTKTYVNTISALMTRRALAFNERDRITKRLSELTGDITAIDRILLTLGKGGDLDAEMPGDKPGKMFRPGELTRAILGEMRGAASPLTSREIARAILAKRGENEPSRRLLYEVTRRVSKALSSMEGDRPRGWSPDARISRNFPGKSF